MPACWFKSLTAATANYELFKLRTRPHCYTLHVDVRRRVLVSFLLAIAAVPLIAAPRPVLVCFGDSITAGYGVQPGRAYPDFLEQTLDRHGYHYRVVNQGTSGATTKDAVASLPVVLQLHADIVIVEFGGNDGLRGLPIEQTRRNLDTVVTTLENAHIKVLVAGITLPPNYGSDYIHAFDEVFRDVAAEHKAALVPMLYKDLVHVPGTIQEDGIHPTAKGAEIIADTLYPALKPLLTKSK
jgi:acyl-CoA thioesterase I